ncbi:MAG: hypothetical protein LBB63_00640 [Holosporaceae bacterium]|jgi:RNA polymerase sigma-54 factor|nr:hypothetical protein [Holosporaceae bacterium]
MRGKADILLFARQQQTLSPSLQYSMKILEMNNLLLTEHIEEKLMENPFLVREYEPVDRTESMENLAEKRRPKDELFEQTAFLHLSSLEMDVALALFHNIGENKYLDNELLGEISRENKIDHFQLLKLINKLKKTSLGWMFTFNLQDKLKTFLENSGRYDSDYVKLVENIDLVLSGNMATLKKRCKLGEQELLRMIAGLKGAFPSLEDGDDDPLSGAVDLLMERSPKNNFEIITNDVLIPKVQFDGDLFLESMKRCHSPLDKKYVKTNATDASLLIKAVNYRNSTLLRVSREIMVRQKAFFLGHDSHLIPINVRSVANVLLLHNSTVHRAIANKVISTPRGTFELKLLLPREIQSASDEISDHFVKEYMKKLIHQESKNCPYSDNDMTEAFHSIGVTISRRTISKYRIALEIPTSASRMQAYRMQRQTP